MLDTPDALCKQRLRHRNSSGEHPRAAETVGIDVYAVRYSCVVLSGILGVNAPKTPDVPYVNVKGMKFVLDTLAETSPKAKSARAEDMVDHRALQEIEASGFVKQVVAGK